MFSGEFGIVRQELVGNFGSHEKAHSDRSLKDHVLPKRLLVNFLDHRVRFGRSLIHALEQVRNSVEIHIGFASRSTRPRILSGRSPGVKR